MFDKVVDMIAAQLPIEKSKITRDSRLLEDCGADSANIMILVMDLESEFDLEVDDEVLGAIKTVGDVVDYLEEHAAK